MDINNLPINVHNEWGELKEVIVGSATGAQIPIHDISISAINYAGKDIPVPAGLYPEQVIEETNEDLEEFVRVLKSRNIKIHRPKNINLTKKISNGIWETNGYYTYCPRDTFTTIGNSIIETPSPLRSRFFENYVYHDIFLSKFKQGSKWISSPKPILDDDLYQIADIDKDTLTLKENEPCFDAANIIKCGKDILYLVSNSGNKLGAQWIRSILGEKYRVHVLENLYSYMHIDSTISFLRPGLVLLNPSRVKIEKLPKFLQSWDHIWSADNVDIGHYPNYCNSSTWIGMNLLMLDEHTAVVEKHQIELIKQLEKKSINVCALSLRHSRTLGGGFHCITNDLYRSGDFEDYS